MKGDNFRFIGEIKPGTAVANFGKLVMVVPEALQPEARITPSGNTEANKPSWEAPNPPHINDPEPKP